MTADKEAEGTWQQPITGGITAALDASKGVKYEDCRHDNWGYYPPLQAIYILWCRTCGTIKQCIPSADEMEIVGARYLNPAGHNEVKALKARVRIYEEALQKIAFDENTSYLACSDAPNCQGIGPHGHAEDCAVGIAREALHADAQPVGTRSLGRKQHETS